MAKKISEFEVDIVGKPGSFFKKFKGNKEDYNFDGLSLLRRILSNEKVRLLNVIKNMKPKSLYELAKFLKRDFKSVVDDVKLLEKFSLIDMVEEKTGKRKRLRPILISNSLIVKLHL